MKAFIDLSAPSPSPGIPGQPLSLATKLLAAGEPVQPGYDKDRSSSLHWVPGTPWNVGYKQPKAPSSFSSLRASPHPASPAFFFLLLQSGSCISSSTFFLHSSFFYLSSLFCTVREASDRLRKFRKLALMDSIPKMLIHTEGKCHVGVCSKIS